MMMTTPPELIDLVDDELQATDELMEPSPEPERQPSDLLKTVEDAETNEEEDDDTTLGREDVEAMMDVCRRMASQTVGQDPVSIDQAFSGTTTTTTVVEQVLVEVEEDEPSWLENKLGPWAARHRSGLRFWLLTLLVVYVSLFASMLLRDGLQGLSERSLTAAVRDLLWGVLMGLIVLLAISKNY